MPRFVYLPGESDRRIPAGLRTAVLWRYVDLPKFLWTLSTGSLWFARADTLGDPYEGSITAAQHETRRDTLTMAARLCVGGREDPEWEARVQQWVGWWQRERVRNTAINCWHMSEHESMAMWKLYAADGWGVALRSSVDRLIGSFPEGDQAEFPDTRGPIQPSADMTKRDADGRPRAVAVGFGPVTYADYSNPDKHVHAENWLESPFIKRKAFEFEREFRAVASALVVDQSGAVTSDRCLFPDQGCAVPVDLDVLIERVYVSPAAPQWFMDVVAESSRRFGRNFPVVQSTLDVDPIY